MERTKENSSQTIGVETDDATTISVAEKAGNAASAGDNRAHSDGES